MNVDEKIKTAELKKEALERNRQGLKKKKKKASFIQRWEITE